MSPTSIAILIVVLVVIAAGSAGAYLVARRRALRRRFGPEYDRLVADQDRATAERELRERERRHTELELRELSAQSQATYVSAWEEVQVRFVDAPHEAVGAADELVTRLIAELGYPTGDYRDQLAHLSVEHASTLGHYRDAHDIHLANERGEASTEQLRQALVHYRALFADLLGEAPRHADDPQTTPR